MKANTGFLARLRKIHKAEDRNYEFQVLPRNKQRMAIADEILRELHTQRIKPKQEYGYIDLDILGGSDLVGDLQSLILSGDMKASVSKFSCTVCALGACVIAKASYVNRLSVEVASDIDQADCRDYMNDLFSNRELRSMEIYFESRQLPAGRSLTIICNTILDADGADDCLCNL